MDLSSGNGGTFLHRLTTKGEAGAEAWLAERNAADPSFWTFVDMEGTLKGLVSGGHTRLVQVAFRGGWTPNAQQWPWINEAATGTTRQAFIDAFAGKVAIRTLGSCLKTPLVKELVTAQSLRTELPQPTLILPLREQLGGLTTWDEAVGRCVAEAMDEPEFVDSNGGCIQKYAPDRFSWIAMEDGRHPLLRFAFSAGLDESAIRQLTAVMFRASEPDLSATTRGTVGQRSLSTKAIVEQLILYPTLFAEAWAEHKGQISQACFQNGSQLDLLQRFLLIAPPSPIKQQLLVEFLESKPKTALAVARHALKEDTDTVRGVITSGAADLAPADWLKAAWETPASLPPLVDLIHVDAADEVRILRTLLTLGHLDPFKSVYVGLNGPKHLGKLAAWLPPEITLAELAALKPSYKSVDVTPVLQRSIAPAPLSHAYSPEL